MLEVPASTTANSSADPTWSLNGTKIMHRNSTDNDSNHDLVWAMNRDGTGKTRPHHRRPGALRDQLAAHAARPARR